MTEKILIKFPAEKRNSVIPCVIIYPVIQTVELEDDDKNIKQNNKFVSIDKLNKIEDAIIDENKIPGFLNFTR